ncbi:MAG: YhdP family protein [Gallionella sp.]|nr:YhdP family protein [Gallionella sp.]
MLNTLPVRILWHSFNWLTRIAIVLSSISAVLIAVAIIVLRYWVLPDVGHYQDRIAASLSRAIGSPVKIGSVAADWKGLGPHMRISDVRILDASGNNALVLPAIDGSVSWWSLFGAELRMANLEIVRPELLVRRDVQGKFFIGGVALSTGGTGNDLSGWLLRQSRMVARDALIVWLDEQRAAPPLVLRNVNLRIESGWFDRHQFALNAVPSEELSTPLDVRGDFQGASFDRLDEWSGQLYARLDYTDVSAWKSWLDMPGEFSRGRGAIRGWLGISEGKLSSFTGDLQLLDVQTKLAADLPEMSLSRLQGRVAWQQTTAGMEVSTHNLSLRMQDGLALQPTDVFYRTDKVDGVPGGELRANRLQLQSLDSLASFLPIPSSLREQIATYAPRGSISNLALQWRGEGKPRDYTVKGHFADMAWREAGAIPGVSGLTFDLDGDQDAGKISIQSRQLQVSAVQAMREPLLFETISGQAGWESDKGELRFVADGIAVSNEDMAGNLFGSYETAKGSPGILDLTVNLTRGDVRRAARYTPFIALDQADNDWLNAAILAGSTDDFHVRVKGNLADFPVRADTKNTLLEVGGKVRDGAIEFDKRWPKVEHINGEFWVRGNKLEVRAESATMLSAQLGKLIVTIPDLQDATLPLDIVGEAQAPGAIFLDFVQKSPVRDYINGFTDGMKAQGPAHLDLNVHTVLLGTVPAKVTGTLRVQNCDIDLGGVMPALRKTNGSLSFTESSIKADNITTEMLGGAAVLNVASQQGGVLNASVKGRSNLDVLNKLNPHPALSRLRGGANWSANVSMVGKTTRFQINSDLVGVSSSLPKPLAKKAGESWPLYLEKREQGAGQDVISAQLGRILTAQVVQRGEKLKRVQINFGAASKAIERDGLWLGGTLAELDLQGWSGLGGDSGSAELPFAGMDLRVQKASGYGMTINGLHLTGAARGDGLLVKLDSETVDGEIEWQERGGGKLLARLQHLDWSGETGVVKPAEPSIAPVFAVADLPTMQLAIENLELHGKQLGRFELVGHPDGDDWRMRRLRITNPDGSVTGDGVWSANSKTALNLQIDISDAGKILARSGYPNTVKAGSGKLLANLTWQGRPDDFDVASLNGSLRLDTGKGQFLKMDPGIGKLLSVLSLQSLPKRITLDFTDVFSDGFQFDSIKGTAFVKNGVMDTQDLRIDGSSAKVTMKGNIDLNRETQDLKVRILPTLGDSVSLLGAFAAGPVIGVGALLVNKVLGDPLDKLVSFEYNVSGSWSDPKVTKTGEKPVQKTDTQPPLN